MNNLKNKQDCFVLSNGVRVPCIGYGTWQTPSGDITRDCVKAAIEQGYRHIDTATAYGNEASVGEGIKLSGISRSEIFVATKHWITDRGYDKTIAACEKSLKELGTDYIDLYLVHWPAVAKRNPDWKEINASTWKGFEKLYKDGKIRAIGVSNFQKKHIDALCEFAEIKPMVNQIEFHPGYTQMDNVRFSQQFGMQVEAWSPLGCGTVLNDPRLIEIAKKYNRSVAQICVKLALTNDVLPLPKSTKPERMASNAEVFDFELAKEDYDALMAIEGLGFSTYYPEEAPADALVWGE